MSDAVALLSEAVAAVRINGPGAFSWFGERHVASAWRGISDRDRAYFLRRELESVLYSAFYCRGGVVSRSGGIDPQRSMLFVARLSAANCGTGCIDRDWHVAGRRGNTVVVEKDGLSFETEADRVEMKGRGSADVRLPKEMLGIAPGFYSALGNRPLPPNQTFRVYWNLRRTGAVAFVRQATSMLNDAALPFRLKVLADASGFDRCDATVLYVRMSDRRSIFEIVRALTLRLRRELRPATPVFSKAVAPGVAVAEQPPGGESFGLHRCGMVAEALISAAKKGKRRVDLAVEEVAARFEREGLSLARPYLNAGSRDVYTVIEP